MGAGLTIGVPVRTAEPDASEDVRSVELTASLTPWSTIVWNDPVNLMSYVSYVFRSYFGYSEQKALRLMLQVHNNGRAIVATGGREEMERHVEAMHGFGLWATLEKADV
jgi:ATP-dependent Clp protease adaptor protein ClpS